MQPSGNNHCTLDRPGLQIYNQAKNRFLARLQQGSARDLGCVEPLWQGLPWYAPGTA